MSRGERVELTGMTAEVVELTDDGRPAEVAFRLKEPLEDDRWSGSATAIVASKPLTRPAGVGERMTLRIGLLLN